MDVSSTSNDNWLWSSSRPPISKILLSSSSRPTLPNTDFADSFGAQCTAPSSINARRRICTDACKPSISLGWPAAFVRGQLGSRKRVLLQFSSEFSSKRWRSCKGALRSWKVWCKGCGGGQRSGEEEWEVSAVLDSRVEGGLALDQVLFVDRKTSEEPAQHLLPRFQELVVSIHHCALSKARIVGDVGRVMERMCAVAMAGSCGGSEGRRGSIGVDAGRMVTAMRFG
ncbi:hypothetical protein BAUCODRAFT_331960 [Baudoinia panamericana UAMH 10762]|uniref:Uncharacterized protein n=1 Tax=Baudoinia panamericana (strain UAMH 10762) TaxID=717646 RepID=M2MWH9_BAUPA|nr:uncharacterized protein BAUCODRAFT_331960 [Baudoinia panamericana UAMH 10762]EMC90939.1 hypothetical protein BAUCODRAFT_331960 [Baudoinia panamericana UAMH 10762]